MKNILILLLITSISGCTSTGAVKSTDALESNNKAQILTENASLLAHFNPLGEKITIKIKSIDNNVLENSFYSGYPTEIETSPGAHDLTLTCSGYIGGSMFHDKDGVNLSISVNSGHIYLLKPNLDNNGCTVEIVDITNQN